LYHDAAVQFAGISFDRTNRGSGDQEEQGCVCTLQKAREREDGVWWKCATPISTRNSNIHTHKKNINFNNNLNSKHENKNNNNHNNTMWGVMGIYETGA
jgi:hypothetical protein